MSSDRRPIAKRCRLGGTLLILCVTLVAGSFGRARPAQAQPPPGTRRVNAPFFDGGVLSDQGAILWFGQVDTTSNYADVRVGYNQDELSITLHIFDRLLWNDTTPATSDLK